MLLFTTAVRSSRAQANDDQQKLNVLILGDSLALCGFGKRLDERFRNDPKVKATFSYMTCGTTPLSWLKHKPYEKVKTQCGYWTIESVTGAKQPKETIDIYGTKRNQAPKPHLVPKLEDLIAATHPDVIVMQSGSNLFGLFPDGKTVHPHDATTLRNYLLPFKHTAINPPSNVRKIYYVNPPTSGRISKEVQDFVFEQTKAQMTPASMVIDSRTLVTYPYQHMEPDKEHFLGAQMDEWADKVFDIIQRDLSAQPIAVLKPLHDTDLVAGGETAAPPAEPPKTAPIVVDAKLVFKSRPMQLKELLPYQESLVAYVYDVKKVLSGQYSERKVLVMHPSFIALKPQPLDKLRIGGSYKLKLEPLEGTLWDTAKSRDESGLINLQPYIRTEDKLRHPGNRTR